MRSRVHFDELVVEALRLRSGQALAGLPEEFEVGFQHSASIAFAEKLNSSAVGHHDHR